MKSPNKHIALIIRGKASGRVVAQINVPEGDKKLTLLKIMQSADIPIASSCQGQGVCQKCIINQELMSCQITMQELLHELYPNQKLIEITVDYL